jgi:hypothetical protein
VGRTAAAWRKVVEPYFGFVTAHGFRSISADDSSWWETSVTYASSKAAIKVSKSIEFQRCEVHLIRLVDGKVPPYPIWITSERIDWALLDVVLSARSPEYHARARRLSGLGKRELEEQLAFWSESLKIVTPEFLEGSLNAIDDAAVITRRQVADHPQQVVAWVPDTASPEAEQQQHSELAATVPPEVAVAVRRYRRPGRRK